MASFSGPRRDRGAERGRRGELSDRVYNYPEGLGEVLYREQFDFNAEPPWEPS
ncbi:hypothetical protein ACRRTK_023301 [Alexandromys fortis]